MLDEEKIKLMTKISIYEKQEEFEGLNLSNYYKEDYVKYGCLRTLVATTIMYWLCVAAYIFLYFEKILVDLNQVDYFKLIYGLMLGYVVVMALFYIYAFIVYNYKYSKARPGLIKYNKMLRKLIKLYESDDTSASIKSGRVKVYSQIGGMDDLELMDERSEESGSDN